MGIGLLRAVWRPAYRAYRDALSLTAGPTRLEHLAAQPVVDALSWISHFSLEEIMACFAHDPRLLNDMVNLWEAAHVTWQIDHVQWIPWPKTPSIVYFDIPEFVRVSRHGSEYSVRVFAKEDEPTGSRFAYFNRQQLDAVLYWLAITHKFDGGAYRTATPEAAPVCNAHR